MLKKILWALLLVPFLLFTAQPVQAHPADEYFHTINVVITTDRVDITWELIPGPILAEMVWFEADLNRDETVSAEEAWEWGLYTQDYFTLSVDQTPLPHEFTAIDWPDDIMGLATGNQPVRMHLSAALPGGADQTDVIKIENNFAAANSINWFTVESQAPLGFGLPRQNRGHLILEIGRQDVDDALLNKWESAQPTLSRLEGRLGAVDPDRDSSRPTTASDLLMNMVLDSEASTRIILLSLLIAMLLGVLHALSPGHGKTVVAAYLVGIQGQPLHAVALGSLVSVTHTGTVFMLGLLAMIAARNLVLLDIFPVLELLSGSLILILGLVLAVSRGRAYLSQARKKRGRKSPQAVKINRAGKATLRLHEPIREEGPSHSHDPKKFGHIPRQSLDGGQPEGINWRSLVMLGISSGLVPCPNAIAILLIAVAVNRIAFGLTMIAAFSLGLAVTLTVIGLVIMQGRRLFQRLQWFDRAARVVPLLSAFALVVIGSFLSINAVPNLQTRPATPVRVARQTQDQAFDLETAGILFLDQDEAGQNQLFHLDLGADQPQQLTQDPSGIRNYLVSPVFAEALYTTIDALDSRIWLIDLVSGRQTLVLDCVEALCANPAWMPDGSGFLYQRLDYGLQEGGLAYDTMYPSIWWFDMPSGETEPLFQDSRLPGINPSFSPDGEWLSYFNISPTVTQLYHLESGTRHEIPTAYGGAPDWSPTGDRFVMADIKEEDGGYRNLIRYFDTVTGEITWLEADARANDHTPAWSPDGEWVAFVRILRDEVSLRSESQVWLMKPDESEARPASEHLANYYSSLHWSPDSRYLLYHVNIRDDVRFRSEIHVLEVATGQITVLMGSGSRPSWALP